MTCPTSLVDSLFFLSLLAGRSAGWLRWPARARRHLTSKREADRHIVYVIVSLIVCIHIPIAVKSTLKLLNILGCLTCIIHFDLLLLMLQHISTMFYTFSITLGRTFFLLVTHLFVEFLNFLTKTLNIYVM